MFNRKIERVQDEKIDPKAVQNLPPMMAGLQISAAAPSLTFETCIQEDIDHLYDKDVQKDIDSLRNHIAKALYRSATILQRRTQSKSAENEAVFVEAKLKEMSTVENIQDLLNIFISAIHEARWENIEQFIALLGSKDKYGLTFAHYMIVFNQATDLAHEIYLSSLMIESEKERKKAIDRLFEVALKTESVPVKEVEMPNREKDPSLVVTAFTMAKLLKVDLERIRNPKADPDSASLVLVRAHAKPNPYDRAARSRGPGK